MTIRVHTTVEDVRLIDFKIEILALEPNLRIGGSDDIKEYREHRLELDGWKRGERRFMAGSFR